MYTGHLTINLVDSAVPLLFINFQKYIILLVKLKLQLNKNGKAENIKIYLKLKLIYCLKKAWGNGKNLFSPLGKITINLFTHLLKKKLIHLLNYVKVI